jgi:hypothetical protein
MGLASLIYIVAAVRWINKPYPVHVDNHTRQDNLEAALLDLDCAISELEERGGNASALRGLAHVVYNKVTGGER